MKDVLKFIGYALVGVVIVATCGLALVIFVPAFIGYVAVNHGKAKDKIKRLVD